MAQNIYSQNGVEVSKSTLAVGDEVTLNIVIEASKE